MSSNDYWNFERETGKIVCPYCGKEWESSAEDTYISGEPVECYKEETQTLICDKCRKRFTMTPILSWEYETETIDGETTKEEMEGTP